ncbi:hypothetical protein SapgrDRAFT_3384 [Saprospira grandis DSM 2844]|uniref:Uncharacterized protein n=1 Tax=Saprospira grandis DSM 2844 TaxID=694433 RepID=J0P559_9BACT|nr:hypothetical protein SapgrDRAFT_3384 [Saprospira grandis DSM 2844]
MKALPLLSFDLISCYSALFFSPIATAMPLKNALTNLKFLSKDGRSAGLPFGLAMCSSAAKPQTKAVRPQGRADLRAAKRSAARPQAAAEAPKKKRPTRAVSSSSLSYEVIPLTSAFQYAPPPERDQTANWECVPPRSFRPINGR